MAIPVKGAGKPFGCVPNRCPPTAVVPLSGGGRIDIGRKFIVFIPSGVVLGYPVEVFECFKQVGVSGCPGIGFSVIGRWCGGLCYC